MRTLTIASNPGQTVVPCRPPAVYVGGARRRDLDVLNVEHLPGPELGRVVMALHPPAEGVVAGRVEQGAVLPPIGSDVLIRPTPGCDAGAFPGRVAEHRIDIGEDAERLVAVVEHRLAATLSAAAATRHALVDGQAVRVDDEPIRFNTDADATASPEPTCSV